MLYNFEIYIYICSFIFLLHLIYMIKSKSSNKIPSYLFILNSFFFIFISNLSDFNYGIYIDEHNLVGNYVSSICNIFNNLAFLIILFLFIVIKSKDKKSILYDK